ncbi:replication restart helicase PriA [Desulfonauticus submarinus]
MDVVKVFLLNSPYLKLDYLPPLEVQVSDLKIGSRVVVPLGKKRICVGIVQSVCFLDSDCEFNLKRIVLPLENPLISETYFKLIEDMSKRYAGNFAQILSNVLPSIFKKIPRKIWIGSKVYSIDKILSSDIDYTQYITYWREKKVYFFKDSDNFLVKLKNKSVKKTRGKIKQAIIDLLKEKNVLSISEIKSFLAKKNIYSSLDKLEREGLIVIFKEKTLQNRVSSVEYKLNNSQYNIAKKMEQVLTTHKFEAHLLHGVTGSGKTFVYLHLLKKCLEQGRSAILLLPEVALAWGMFKRLKKLLSYKHIYFYTGNLPDLEKQRIFYISSHTPTLIIGTRSSIFLPFYKLGLIIVDEEHVESYKQEQGIYYQTKEIVYFLAKQSNALLLLGSATPDIKTFYSANQGNIFKHTLDKRFGLSLPPKIIVIDLKNKQNKDIFSQRIFDKLSDVITKGEQVIILHNRRGYCPILYCSSCGNTIKCPSCDISLTYHKKINSLMCHYCGFKIKFPPICSVCESSNFSFYGEGTEKIEEFLKKKFPNITILRLDKDIVQSRHKFKEILQSFERGEGQVLIGTQMLSKGHDFANVTLGIVLDGDLGLNFPDYRARERLFQLLVQLCGRVGRRDKRGEVYIQTRNKSLDFWNFVENGDYIGFCNQELKKRKLFDYPPFVNLGLIRVSFARDWEEKDVFLDELTKQCLIFAKNFEGKVLGPVPAPIYYLHSKYRYHILLKSLQWSNIRTFFLNLKTNLLDKRLLSKKRQFQLILDLDPVSIL